MSVDQIVHVLSETSFDNVKRNKPLMDLFAVYNQLNEDMNTFSDNYDKPRTTLVVAGGNILRFKQSNRINTSGLIAHKSDGSEVTIIKGRWFDIREREYNGKIELEQLMDYYDDDDVDNTQKNARSLSQRKTALKTKLTAIRQSLQRLQTDYVWPDITE